MKEHTTALKEWARREIDLATSGEDFEMKSIIDEHYEVAYQAFCDFVEKIEDLDKPGLVKTIFTMLLHEEALTPIEDNEEDWFFVEGFDPSSDNMENANETIYECKRRPSLYKKVTYDGDKSFVEYADSKRSLCVDINSEVSYSGGIGPAILNEMFPITMPYSPIGKIKIYTEDFKYHEDSKSDFDTVGVLYFRFPDGRMEKVKRFFKLDHETNKMIEISSEEYIARRNKAEGQKRGL